jgi:hypothetical protein
VAASPHPGTKNYLIDPLFIQWLCAVLSPLACKLGANRPRPLRYKYGTARILRVLNDLLDLGCFAHRQPLIVYGLITLDYGLRGG